MAITRSQSKRRRQEQDIISDMTDCILIHTLSFLDAKQAVQTCILSKRWIILWKTLPTLNLTHFGTQATFNQFVVKILSLRDSTTTLRTLNLYRPCPRKFTLLYWIIEYALSHNVQHLLIDRICQVEDFPSSSTFSSHTLTSLNLSGAMYETFVHRKPIFPNSLNCPALTSLSLKHFAFAPSHDDDDGFVDPFSTFKMLNTLVIDLCRLLNAQNLRITTPNLVNLTILMWMYPLDIENPFYIGVYFGIELYAPSLHTFAFNGCCTPKLFGSNNFLSSIKHVTIGLTCYLFNPKSRETSPLLLNWLVELVDVESLTFCSDTIEIFSSIPDLLNVEFHSLCKLKSLNITTGRQHSSMCDKMVPFLIQNSPLPKVDIIHL